MRIIVLLLAICLMAGIVFAQENVNATITGFKVADRDYIWIQVEYDLNGVKVINNYPMDFKNIVGKTPQEIKNWIDINIQYQCDRYIEAEFRKKVNANIILNKLQSLTNTTYTKNTTDLLFDTNNDDKPDKKWTVKMDGAYVETNLP